MSQVLFTLVCGSDDFLVNRKAGELWQKMEARVDDPYACERIDGRAGTVDEVGRCVDQLAAAVQTLSMFGETKAIWLQAVSFFGESGVGKTEGAKQEVERLQELLGSIDPTQVQLLITASPVDRRRRTFKWMQSNAEFHWIEDSKDESALVAIVQAEAKQQGCAIGEIAARYLLARIQGNSRLALLEVQKLATYLGSEGVEIDESLITELTPVYGEGDQFEAAEAFFARDLAWALDALRRHFFTGHGARMLIASLQNRNRLLIQLRVLQDQGAFGSRLNGAALERMRQRYGHHWKGVEGKSSFQFFSQHPYYLSRLAANASKFSLKQLIRNQVEFLHAFQQLIERADQEETVMRELVLRCLA